MEDSTISGASRVFAALSNPTRLRIAELLCKQERSVGEVSSVLGLRQSATSQYLAELTRSGVLCVVNKGSHRIYRVRGPRIARILMLTEEYCRIHNLHGETDQAVESDLQSEAEGIE